MNHYYQTDEYGYPVAIPPQIEGAGYPVPMQQHTDGAGYPGMPHNDERIWGGPFFRPWGWGWGWGFGAPFFRPWGFGFPFFPFFW
ncbi:hypothetical protein ACFSCZ_12275 [Siminovitchia sediminis]|uniref:Spore coat protein n=1 Tax=Siminovitchia sediminis TaxID=1274353 RepID=A0ABW4KL46_9BACI